jgi:hypothetical protein
MELQRFAEVLLRRAGVVGRERVLAGLPAHLGRALLGHSGLQRQVLRHRRAGRDLGEGRGERRKRRGDEAGEGAHARRRWSAAAPAHQ